MKADYITLKDDRKVRIEWNMNALDSWGKITGKEMSDLAAGKADIGDLRTIAWCAAVEGELCDGRDLGLNEVEFGRLLHMQAIIEFSKILTEQSSTVEQKKSEAPRRSPLIFFRKKV
jgi:hypothetical protein